MAISLKQKSYEIIRSKIINCEYAPNTFITEDFLCNELNVSRTPIRDALSRLEQENLVKIKPKKGVLIAPVTINEINSIYETRLLLEPYILSTYGSKIGDDLLQKLNDILDNLDSKLDDIQTLYDLDDEFHQIIVNLCENTYLIKCYNAISAQNARLRVFSGNQNMKRLVATHEEHKAVVDQILARNYIQAGEFMEDHLLSAKQASFKVLFSGNYSI